VKTKFALCVTVAALGSVLSSAAVAEPARMRVAQMVVVDALPPYEINTIVRSMGLDPLTHPQRRGPYYVLDAVDPRGFEVRVVADARIGAVISVTPAAPARYNANPRIIHVPPPATVGALPDDPDDVDEPLPPRQPQQYDPRQYDPQRYDPRHYDRPPQRDNRRVTAPPPKPAVKSAAVPPPPIASPEASAPAIAAPTTVAPPRAVVSQPESSLYDGPTPIRPLPKLGKSERFSSPDPKTTASVAPPAASQPSASAPSEPAKSTAPAAPSDKSIEMPPVAPLE